jgi:murein DD-endopeptidase MepM/ murein hydrolase activator NlpD
VPYLLGQARRARRGPVGLAGNHVIIAIEGTGPFLLLAHLQRGSVQLPPGQWVREGDPVGRCGNSGNSTEPHLHLQVSDSTDWTNARGLPITFRAGTDRRGCRPTPRSFTTRAATATLLL